MVFRMRVGKDRMNIIDGPDVGPRLRHFLTEHVARRPRTDPQYIRRETRAFTLEGREVSAPDGGIDYLIAFEDRFGGLSYAVPGWPNEIEYGLDGDATLRQTSLGWAFYGVLDGSLTAPLDVLLDGRVTARLGNWPQRVVDDSVEQRMTKHALLVEISPMPRAQFTHRSATAQPPIVQTLSLPPVAEASGGGDLWWRDDDSAVWMHLTGWPEDGPDRWTITCFSSSQRRAEKLLENLQQSTLR